MGMRICRGLALATGSGANCSARMGLTTRFTESIPEVISGAGERRISGETVLALGIRLRALSRETGHTSRRATSPQRMTFIHLGAFFSRNRAAVTASTTQTAQMLRLTA